MSSGERLLHNLKAGISWWLWLAAALAVVMLASCGMNYTGRSMRRRLDEQSEQLKTTLTMAARERLYVVINIQVLKTKVKVTCRPSDDVNAEAQTYSFLPAQIGWVEGMSSQAVAWFPRASFDDSWGYYTGGSYLRVMSAENPGLRAETWEEENQGLTLEQVKAQVALFSTL